MSDLVLTTFDWVPEPPRGFVRDLRIRWALEEAGLPYRVESTPFEDRKAEHFAHQPFGQVPWRAAAATSGNGCSPPWLPSRPRASRGRCSAS